jgi:hypothetical protein
VSENDERGAEGGDRTPPPQGPGRMRFQDGSTTPREPTLAERRARERAQQREWEAEKQRIADEEAAKRKRKRILVGAGVTVGVVALIAVGYSVAQPDEEVVARCVGEDGTVVDESNCVTPAANNSYYGGGGFFPIFIGSGGRQYHYNYGGTGAVGQQVRGGTTTVPSNARVTTPSGKTISRGGLGVSRGSSGSGS